MLLMAREAEIIIAAFAVYPAFSAVDFIIAMTAKEEVAAVCTDGSGATFVLTKIKVWA